MMNKEGKSNKKNYVAVFAVLVLSLIFVTCMLNMFKPEKKAKPMTTEATTTIAIDEENSTTTQVIIDNNEENKPPVNVESVSNFDSSLYEIISSLSFYGNYDLTTYYHGVEFNFKCTNYNTDTDECLEGSALMKESNVLYPLFTYSNENDNYFNNSKDFYISFSDNMVVLVNNYVGVYAGTARFFDRKGNNLGTVNNVITGYKYGDNLFRGIYPNIEDNRFYYYYCNNGVVNISSVGLGNYKDIIVEEAVDGTCNY